jgi:carbonic anhydrase
MTEEPFETNVAAMIEASVEYATGFHDAELQVQPTLRVAIVACMDSRMNLRQILGLGNGEAHIIRNAGGIVTDDVIRSLCLSQRTLGTREIVLVHHTDCGLQKVEEDAFRAELEAEYGVKPRWAVEAFKDPFVDVRQSIQRLRITPFVPHKEHISGFVYDVTTGLLHQVEAAG